MFVFPNGLRGTLELFESVFHSMSFHKHLFHVGFLNASCVGTGLEMRDTEGNKHLALNSWEHPV